MKSIIEEDPAIIMVADLKKDAEDFLQNIVISKLADYELRQPQVEMLGACSDIIEEGGTLIVEAGTGTGKTFAYLIPLILSGKKSIVTTRTKNLQEQLIAKDLAFLSSLRDFDYAIAKGRSNYLCLRRLNSFTAINVEEMSYKQAIIAWEAETETGDIEELAVKKSPVQERICSDGDACKGKKCSFYRECYYFKARRKWEMSQIVVVNHALLAINAMLPEDSKILPKAEVLVIDEGHALDSVLSGQIGITLSRYNSDSILNRLLKAEDKESYKGILSKSHNLFGTVEALREEIDAFWYRVSHNLKDRSIIKNAARLEDALRTLAASIKSLTGTIRVSVLGLFREDEEVELEAAIAKLTTLAEEMERFANGGEGFVRWPEIEERKTALRMAPIYPKDFMKDNIIPAYRSLILTSATLAVGGNFGLTQDVLGLEDATSVALNSPFDLHKQVVITVNRKINFQKGDEAAEKLSGIILDEARKQDGGILVLFTSRKIMKGTWDLVSDELGVMGRNPMQQGDIPNSTMLAVMRKSTNAVIFGLESFWEGVDVKGDSLKSLIITKLPFEVPSEPMVVARVEAIQRGGGNSFNEYSLPKAILKFKQGFGRLIRSKNDRGRVIICDERIETRDYGRRFIESVL